MSKPSAAVQKPSMRVCHLADVHLGYRRYTKLSKSGVNQREIDINLAFQEAITRIVSLKPDVTIIAGDLFHAVRPSNAIVAYCFRQLRRLARETRSPVVVVAGNHETPKRADTGSPLQLLAEIDNVFVADGAKEVFTFKERDVAITCLPHAALLDREGLALRADDRFAHNILVVHGQVNERWISDFGGAEIELKALSPHEWDYIALGHVHLHRPVALNAAYSGALEHTASNIWSEANAPKGFLEVELPSAKRTFHPLTSPREVVVVDPLEVEGLEPSDVMRLIADRLTDIPGGIEGKIIRLELKGLTREIYRHLDHKELRALRARALHLAFEITFAAASPAARLTTHPGKGLLKDQLREFSAGFEVPGASKEELADLLDSYVSRVEASHEAS
jgi:DNA repair exonuclease SbcCD nuclease subunit